MSKGMVISGLKIAFVVLPVDKGHLRPEQLAFARAVADNGLYLIFDCEAHFLELDQPDMILPAALAFFFDFFLDAH
jgi:hypothetical protein